MHYSLDYFGSFPREAIRIAKYMIDCWPQRKLFKIDDLQDVTHTTGRSLSGALSSFAKRRGRPLIIKAGTVGKDDEGHIFTRPKQLWALNPLLKEEELALIREHLEVLDRLDH